MDKYTPAKYYIGLYRTLNSDSFTIVIYTEKCPICLNLKQRLVLDTQYIINTNKQSAWTLLIMGLIKRGFTSKKIPGTDTWTDILQCPRIVLESLVLNISFGEYSVKTISNVEIEKIRQENMINLTKSQMVIIKNGMRIVHLFSSQ